MWTYRANLVKVLDGDTVRLNVDLGFYTFIQMDLRLAGVFAPEMNQPGGPEAKVEAQTWLDVRPDYRQSWPLQIITQREKKDEYVSLRTFTRYVGDVLVFGTEESLNEHMIDWLSKRNYSSGA